MYPHIKPKLPPIRIFKGDDSCAFGVRTIEILLETEIDLTGATSKFELLSYSRTFTTEETISRRLRLSFSAAETARFPLGLIFGKIQLFDAHRFVMSTSPIPFEVVFPGGLGPCAWRTYGIPVSVVVKVGIDYRFLLHKPTIEGVVVEGKKSAADYNIATLDDLSKISPGAAEGYYDEDTGEFYEDAEHTKLMEPRPDTLYMDLTKDRIFRYDAASAIYVMMTEPATHVLDGMEMPDEPTQRQLNDALNVIWLALGGSIG